MNSLLDEPQDEVRSKYRTTMFCVGGIVLIALVIGAYFLILPKHGEKVNMPAGLEDEIRAHFAKENRSVAKMTAYYCTNATPNGSMFSSGRYVVHVNLDWLPSDADKIFHTDISEPYRKVIAEEISGHWAVVSRLDFSPYLEPGAHPCTL